MALEQETGNTESSEYDNLDQILHGGEPIEEPADQDEFEDQEEDESNEEESEDESNEEESEEENEESEGEEESEEEDDSEEEESEDEEQEEEEVKLPVWAQKIKDQFPDRTFDSLDDYDAANAEYMESLETTISTNKETEAQLVNIFNQHQELAQMFGFLNKGYSPRAALVAAGFSPEDFVIQDGDEDAEQLAEAKINRRNAIAQKQKEQAKIEANSKKSKDVIAQFQSKKGIKDTVQNKFLQEVENVFNSFLEANINEDTLEMFWKALNYDSDKRKAEDQGRIKGRNEKIAIKKKQRKGDGVARLSSAQAKTPSKKTVYDDPFVEILDKLAKSDR